MFRYLYDRMDTRSSVFDSRALTGRLVWTPPITPIPFSLSTVSPPFRRGVAWRGVAEATTSRSDLVFVFHRLSARLFAREDRKFRWTHRNDWRFLFPPYSFFFHTRSATVSFPSFYLSSKIEANENFSLHFYRSVDTFNVKSLALCIIGWMVTNNNREVEEEFFKFFKFDDQTKFWVRINLLLL